MKIRNVDKNNDWLFGKGQSDYVRDAYAVARDIKMKLQEWYGDCFFALNHGIPWDRRLGEHNQKQFLDKDIYDTVMSVEGVLNVYNFTSSLDERRYRCSFKVYQEYSTETLPINFDTEEIQ